MPDPTSEFFDQLGRRGHEPVLEEVAGTIRFDLRDEHGTNHWFVEIRNGDVRVSRETRPADCVLHTDRAVFDQMVTGQLHHMPAWLRRLFWLEGNALLFRIFGTILPGSPDARHPYDIVPDRRRRR
jgi:putative sterol carrier protein